MTLAERITALAEAIAADIKITEFHKDIAVFMVQVFYRLHILMEDFRVEDLTRTDRQQLLDIRRLFHRIARNLNALQHRILQQMIGYDDALRHYREARIEIIEIPGIIQCIPVFINC